jgi:phosphoribosylformylglycinamidine synthase subunit PurL
MGEFVESIRGIADACREIRLKSHPDHPIPVVAGNVSLYNETRDGCIPPSPMIGCVGRIDDVDRAVTPGFKAERSALFLIGARTAAMGGSVYQDVIGKDCARMPSVGFAEFGAQVRVVTDLIGEGKVLAGKAIGPGGLAAALGVMCFQGDFECRVWSQSPLRKDFLLFNETPGFVLEVSRDQAAGVAERLEKERISHERIGETVARGSCEIQGILLHEMEMLKQGWLSRLEQA